MKTDISTTSIFSINLNLDLDKIQKYCYKLQRNDKEKRTLSNIGGWQSSNLEGEHTVLNNLFLEMEKYSIKFFETLKFNTDSKFNLVNIWVNINKYKDYNRSHFHPGAYFSCIFFVKTPKNSGSLVFNNLNRLALSSYWNKDANDVPISYNKYNAESWEIIPKENTLIIFPSFLEHEVRPHMNKKKERISVASNVIKV
jgi:uncharacterized protein (TIGR02466 family)|tara:strand:+ start:3567 stop:4160 length:594 start_codon:yes stop_codon:yes gene_type:complete